MARTIKKQLNSRQGDLEVCSNPAEVAQGVADRILLAAERAIQTRGRFHLALAGGSSPRATYTLLAQLPRRAAIDWGRTFILFGDERCVPPTHDDSNYKMASQTLFSSVPIPAEQIFRMQGEILPATAARRYADALRALLHDELVIDFVLLGLGPDAHTASWFPDVVIDESLLVDAPFIPQLQAHRLTLTSGLINAAREIVVEASGSAKAQALAAVLGPQRNPLHLPAQRLAPFDGTLTWLVDQEAASVATNAV